MSKVIKAVAALGVLSALSGCFLPDPAPEEIVIVEPAPVVVEPVSGKF
ncbi:hypothetical protein [Jannaschia pohangensis]|uniref:Lipoprotein n=1 Tax=Jannaschia pohangensis TaxID=390807 RepID=A0A1I3ILS1_9RHOB|nr:hypothetical protein [Jannaschia pohangensis]SFI48886.1 hypothetical protein SAMN04488095_1025 [Jannaschia pohangensis]